MSVRAMTLALALVCAPAAAQDWDDRPMREEFEGMMEAYVLSKLQESLDLTDEQFAKMVVAQKKLLNARREYRRERNAMLRDLRRALEGGGASDEDLAALLESLTARKRELVEEEEACYQEVDAVLSVRQRARYRILEVEIQRRLQELVRQIREGNRERRQGSRE